jgi:hypothetical protein
MMDVVGALGGVAAAFGLSTSAGLNAYIPLLMVSLAARFPAHDPLLKLAEPYDIMANVWVIGILVILLLIEMFVDKIPAVDTINDVIQTFVRPAAGAVLFAANANVVTDINPVFAIIAGLLVAGSVHTAKGITRPAITATTAGTGNWLVSILEDATAVVISILSILVPIILGLVLMATAGVAAIHFWRRRQQRKTLAY